jgi:foldase protein PrsA
VLKKQAENPMGVVWVVAALGFAVISAFLGYRLTQTSDTSAVATVNGEKITRAQVYDRLVQQGGKDTVGRMIEEMLVNQEAKRLNVTVSDTEITAEINRIQDQLGGEARFFATLAQYGVTLEQLRFDLTHNLRMKKLILKDIVLSDEELKAWFEQNRDRYDEEEQVKARHVLVRTLDDALAVKAELDKGADFVAIAAAKSEDPGSKEIGGDLGFFGRGDMVPEFEQVAFTLEVGKVSDPVQSSFGFHVIQVTDKKAAKVATFEEVKGKVSDAVKNEKYSQLAMPFMESLKARAKITNTLDDKQG